jgi:hypothetical protein
MKVTPTSPPPAGSNPKDRSIVNAIAWLFGILLVLFSAASVLNTIFQWKIAVKGVQLPDAWDATIGLIGVTVLFWIIFAILTYVPPVQRFGKRHPWWMALFVVAGLVGAIVIITVIDNANIKARHEKFLEEQRQDSLRAADSLARVQPSPAADSMR